MLKQITSFVSFALIALLVYPGLTSTSALSKGMNARTVDDLPFPVVALEIIGNYGGLEVNHTGTIEQVVAQLHQENPGWVPDFSNNTAASPTSDFKTRSKVQIQCCPVPDRDWTATYSSRIEDGIDYLNGLGSGATCHCKASSCVRISCSYNSAIYYCNAHTFDTAPSCTYLASYATDIDKLCRLQSSPGSPYTQFLVCGIESDSDSYSVVVKADNC